MIHSTREILHAGVRHLSAVLLLIATVSVAEAADVVHLGIAQTMRDSGYYIASRKATSATRGHSRFEMTPFKVPQRAWWRRSAPASLTPAAGRCRRTLQCRRCARESEDVATRCSMRRVTAIPLCWCAQDLFDNGRYKAWPISKGMKAAVAGARRRLRLGANEALKKGGLTFSDADVVYMGFPEQLAAYRNKGIRCQHQHRADDHPDREEKLAARIAGDDAF